jgi:hypothetical protein
MAKRATIFNHSSKIRLYWPSLYGDSAAVQILANFPYSMDMVQSTYFLLSLIPGNLKHQKNSSQTSQILKKTINRNYIAEF